MLKQFEELVSEAGSQPFEGWDFSYLEGRLVEGATPWDYRGIVSGLLPGAGSLLDLGTGGGELLSTLGPLPPKTFATEGYQPNVPVAGRRLHPLGVEVIQSWCDDNDRVPQRGGLPFRDGSIDVVIDRHESFIAGEVFRVLGPSGRFVTQQVGGTNYPELNRALGAEEPPASWGWGLEQAVRQVEESGLKVEDAREATLEAWFYDVGAVVYYLRAVPWQIPGFSLKRHQGRLRELDRAIRRDGPFRVTTPRFLVLAQKPKS